MSLVGQVGRRRFRARFAMVMLYVILCIGALTTVYPFIIMVSTGLKGPTDQNDNKIVPTYLTEDPALVAKFVDDKYAGDKGLIASTRTGEKATPEEVAKYEQFLLQLPVDDWVAGFRIAPNQVNSRLADAYQLWLRKRYKGNIEAVNQAYLEENVAFQTISPPAEMPERKSWRPAVGKKFEEWREFKATLPAYYRIPVTERWMFQKFLMAKYQNQFGSVPPELKGSAKRFEEIAMPPTGPITEAFRAQESDRFRAASVEGKWKAFSGLETPLPSAGLEAAYVAKNGPDLRKEFAGRNYHYVLDYILINGRAVLNTAIFCLLAIATQLTVNPLAAYALSRYPIRQSGAILMFLLATMAFPAEVAMIPSFLLLKNLGLLNTFAALVLPTAASGYMIFLLKGFFDSLPQELFEAGSLDGAKESTMMLRIALPLSRPVLGYLALIAFMGAYGSFIYAFLVAQDQRVWTLMVWIYQLQSVAPKAVIMAALTLAAVPTLLVFLFAQRVIMRGIVLPGER